MKQSIGYIAAGYYLGAGHSVTLNADGFYEYYHAGPTGTGTKQVDTATLQHIQDISDALKWNTTPYPTNPGYDKGYSYFFTGERGWIDERDAPHLAAAFILIDHNLTHNPGALKQRTHITMMQAHGGTVSTEVAPILELRTDADATGSYFPVCDRPGCGNTLYPSSGRWMCPYAQCDAMYCTTDCYAKSSSHEHGEQHARENLVFISATSQPIHMRVLKDRVNSGNSQLRRSYQIAAQPSKGDSLHVYVPPRYYNSLDQGDWSIAPMPRAFLPFSAQARVVPLTRIYRAYKLVGPVVLVSLESDQWDPIMRWINDGSDLNVKSEVDKMTWAGPTPYRYEFEVALESANTVLSVLERHNYIDMAAI